MIPSSADLDHVADRRCVEGVEATFTLMPMGEELAFDRELLIASDAVEQIADIGFTRARSRAAFNRQKQPAIDAVTR